MPGNRLAVVLRQRWIWVPGVHMRRCSLGENMHHMLGLGRKMRRSRVERGQLLGRPRTRSEHLFSQQSCQAQRPESHPCALEKLAAGHKKVVQPCRMALDVLVVAIHNTLLLS